jgi:hypothetical protein
VITEEITKDVDEDDDPEDEQEDPCDCDESLAEAVRCDWQQGIVLSVVFLSRA